MTHGYQLVVTQTLNKCLLEHGGLPQVSTWIFWHSLGGVGGPYNSRDILEAKFSCSFPFLFDFGLSWAWTWDLDLSLSILTVFDM